MIYKYTKKSKNKSNKEHTVKNNNPLNEHHR